MAKDVDQVLNRIAGDIVMLDSLEVSSLKAVMDAIEAIEHPALRPAVNKFKTLLLDAATGQAGDLSDALNRIQREFSVLQETWEQVRGEAIPPVVAPVNHQEPEVVSASDAQPAPVQNYALPVGEEIEQDPELIQGFVQESKEHLDSIEVNIIEWEANPHDKELINAIFRPFHTIKGMAGFLNLLEIQSLAHELENLLDAAREGKIQFSRDLADLILQGVDILQEMIRNVLRRLEGKPTASLTIDPEAVKKKTKQMLSKRLPEKELPRFGALLVQEETVTAEELKDALKLQTDGDPRYIGEILVEEKNVPPGEIERVLNLQARKERDVNLAKSLKVDTVKMDSLFDMVGELVITNNMLFQNRAILELNDRQLNSDLAQLKRIVNALQNVSLAMRMVPIAATFQKMRRVVYDIAQKSGKMINLKMLGESTEIDRNLVDSLYDPMLHMVRNACDHGIETTRERVRVGKPEAGTISLDAYQKGGHIFIEIRDDGAGIDPQKIRKKAIERGLIGEDDELDDHALMQMIFKPGFSTAENITDISGRGVGMDVVKRATTRLGGRIDLTSEVGQGSCFIIKFPLTLAIIDGIVVKVGSERYILPTIHVREALRLDQSSYNVIAGKGETVLIRDRVYPLIRVHRFFGVPDAISEPWEAILILVESEFRDIAMQVDEIIGKQEVVIKNLGERFADVQGVSGGAILGDGRIGLILDVNQLDHALIGV